MKNIILFFAMLTFFKGNTQCTAPSNLTLSFIDASSAQLSWTENGTSNEWEIAIIPDFMINSPLPSHGVYRTTGNQFTVLGLSTDIGCTVFFVRSVCSVTDNSTWIAVGTIGCSTNVNNYLSTLSENDFSFSDKVNLYPNPSNNILFIDSLEKQIKKIEFFDLQGRIIKIINESNYKHQLDISGLLSTSYLIRLSTETEYKTIKFIKN